MKSLLLVSLSLLSTAAFADTRCSDANGRVQYVHLGYDRGIPPRDGDVIDTIELRVDGALVSQSEAFQGKAADLGPINPDFSDIRILKQDSLSKDFTATLVLSKNASNAAASRLSVSLPLSTLMICHESDIQVP